MKKRAGKGKNKKSMFGMIFAIYMLWLLVMIMGGLALLWVRMDAYEKSRPEKTMENYMASHDGSYWNKLLIDNGVSKEYADTFDFSNASFLKKLELYTDDMPVYSVRSGDKEVFSVSLTNGKELKFGYHEWEIGEVKLTGSKISIYVPEDAAVSINGEKISADYMVQKNAQDVQLGLFDEAKNSEYGLAKYQLETIYSSDDFEVKDESGNVLELSETAGASYYYAPLMSDYKIAAPTDSTVTVNGIELAQGNAEIETRPNKDFEGLENFVDPLPEQKIYTIEGLIMKPDIVVKMADGSELPVSVDGNEYTYAIPAGKIEAKLSEYVMSAFDAYIAFIGGRGGNLEGNLNRYISYAAPDSDVYIRAKGAWRSLQWVKGRDARFKSAQINSYTPYSDKLFTCQIDYTLADDEKENANSCLFIFVKYKGEWKLAKILNTTSFVEVKPN